MPPSRPQGAFPEVVKRKPAAGSPAESQAEKSPGRPVVEIQGIYIISVAARILEMHPQTLRKYERLGLVNPERTGGMLRLYSREDIRKILLIRHLMDNLGLNLAGVEFALNLVENLVELERRLASAVADASLRETIEQEVSRLYRRLNLPV
jgi:MerR family transcriptional regulator/heat shock protein HspR